MKLTKTQLRRLIRETVREQLNEMHSSGKLRHGDLMDDIEELARERDWFPQSGESLREVPVAKIARLLGVSPEEVVTAIETDIDDSRNYYIHVLDDVVEFDDPMSV